MARKVKPSELESTYDPLKEPIVLSKTVIDTIMTTAKELDIPAGDMIGLYIFYYSTGKWQRTNRVRATVEFCATGLGYGLEKVRKARTGLLHAGLIEDIQVQEDNGLFMKRYVEVKFMWSASATETVLSNSEARSTVLTENRTTVKPSYGKMETNALSVIKGNALSNDKEIRTTAQEILDIYKKTIKKQCSKSAMNSIIKTLKLNVSRETLVQAVKNYAAVMSADPQFRIFAHNFFGRDERWREYEKPHEAIAGDLRVSEDEALETPSF